MINPFLLDEKRNKLSLENEVEFLKTYKINSKILPNINDGKFWDRIYHEEISINHMVEDRLKIISNFISKINKKIKLLDLGIGNGWIEEKLKSKNIQFTGVDISSEAIKKLQNKIDGKFIVGDISNFESNERYDVVLLLETLEHIPSQKTFEMINRIRKLLNNDGILIVSVPVNERVEELTVTCPKCGCLFNSNGHLRDYTENIIKKELEISGFNVEKIYRLYAFNKFYFFKKLLTKILPNRWKPNNLILVARKITEN